jgi:hypothetical protein
MLMVFSVLGELRYTGADPTLLILPSCHTSLSGGLERDYAQLAISVPSRTLNAEPSTSHKREADGISSADAACKRPGASES